MILLSHFPILIKVLSYVNERHISKLCSQKKSFFSSQLICMYKKDVSSFMMLLNIVNFRSFFYVSDQVN